ncbi:hypothetical protein EJ08DRAFT_424242 [Tothia fuscella]|uniref:Uncharacterized protein n=1 Tax=Tothia fuscella TaxID=1048955 RepID=A0A9P4TVE9_9PEZI|nr:hypothetical protein EJ08DRAFT_424242 [Tothia fuscella]
MHSRWHSDTSGYRSLDSLYAAKENVAWYWRFMAQLATWMILGGYLVLPSTFDSNSQLRYSKGVLAIIIVSLLTAGYSLTALLWFACPSLLFRLESIFTPNFAVSVFAFLATMYAFASSPRYSFSEAMGPTTLGMAAASAIIYGVLALIAQRKVKKIADASNVSAYYRSMAGTPSTMGRYQEPGYYQNFVQNIYPTARSPGAASFDAPTKPFVSEEDMVNQQMAMLLTKNDPGPSPDASQTTFRLEWPQGTEQEEEFDAFGRRRMRTFSASGRLLTPGSAAAYGSRTGNDSTQQSSNPSTWAKLGRAVGVDRGRLDVRGESSHARRKSREERRQEIEMGQLSS